MGRLWRRVPGPADAPRHPGEEDPRSVARAAALAGISELASEAGTDLRAVLWAVAERISTELGPVVVIRVMAEDSERLEHTFVYHPHPLMRAALEQVCPPEQEVPPALMVHVVRSGETVRLRGTEPDPWLSGQVDPSVVDIINDLAFHALLVVPLRARGRVIGTMAVGRDWDGEFSDEDEAFLCAMAERSAAAIENSRLLERARRTVGELRRAHDATRHRANQQATLAGLAQRAVAGGDHRVFLDLVTRAVAETLDLELVLVLTASADRRTLVVSAASGFGEDLSGLTIPGDHDARLGYALDAAAPVVVEDAATETRFRIDALLLDRGITSGIATAIRGRDRTYGVLGVHTVRTRSFTADEITFIESVAELLGAVDDGRAVREAEREQALHDQLTGLPNRALLQDRLTVAADRAARTGCTTAVLVVNLDRFSDVNDGFGHAAGDAVLARAGERLLAVVRPGDTVGRWGGDQFAVVAEDVDDEHAAMALAQRLQEAFVRPFTVDRDDIVVSVSIGVAVLGGSGTASNDATAAVLIDDAASAVHRAKTRGGASIEVFDDRMRARAAERLRTQAALRSAVERDELRLLYQPIVAVHDGSLAAVEALLRWAGPDGRLAEPSDIIPVAQQAGLLLDVGGWALSEACRQAAGWNRDDGRSPLNVAINLAGSQLYDPELLARIRRAIDDTGVDPAALSIDVPEIALGADPPAATAVLRALRSLGVRLAIDDFGRGSSSLPNLERFPVDAVKVDREFVAGLGTDANDSAVVGAAVALARSLGLVIIAEGVETAGQLAELRALGVNLAQGFYFAHPLPAAAIDALRDGGPLTGRPDEPGSIEPAWWEL